jgi:hypothetical protein
MSDQANTVIVQKVTLFPITDSEVIALADAILKFHERRRQRMDLREKQEYQRRHERRKKQEIQNK